ncbi:hypothetical protein [Caballeronia sp. SBC2]|uniref:hypothetical protein n=1 Tax=Caballeronia sp. SBC2 TaxID=2705547 RepID=UPI0013E10E4D|nr:hypothetical protein [Caballeronia sp. SBC2]QIE29607.1 hypothetical protein SBC2_76830 [Caballeronia sp. SBC2]
MSFETETMQRALGTYLARVIEVFPTFRKFGDGDDALVAVAYGFITPELLAVIFGLRVGAIGKSTSAYVVQKVYFGTDRQILGNAPENAKFGVQRAKQLTYGEVDVSIPRDHRLGRLESPSVWELESNFYRLSEGPRRRRFGKVSLSSVGLS